MRFREHVDHFLPSLLREVHDGVCGIVGAHSGKKLSNLLIGSHVQEFGLLVVLKLLEHISLQLGMLMHFGEQNIFFS
ncbi:MAG: hypothetical protein NVS3B5_00170 [Sphingomicrobium sp.]